MRVTAEEKIEDESHNPKVGGSNPPPATNLKFLLLNHLKLSAEVCQITTRPESTIASTLPISRHVAFSDMKLGFIGTGEITSSIVTGLCSSVTMPHSIRLSPRNPEIARRLANRFSGVSISSCNQEVLDHCDTIVIAVRPQVARDVLSELHFRPDHQVVSLVSGLSLRSVSEIVAPAVRVTRAVPLPSTAKRLSPTGIYPPEPASCDLFAALGTVFALESENEFDAMCAVTATMAAHFAFMERIGSWLAQHGIPELKARDYIARMFWGLTATAVDAPERSFRSLAGSHATAGGINEQFLRYLTEHGLLTNVSEALDAVLSRISKQ
jgi:pyrroline-5-carboxylate reductase